MERIASPKIYPKWVSLPHKKSTLKLSRLHRRIKNIRKDFLNKTSTEMAKTKSVVIIEDLNVKGMVKNHRLARSISDVSWGEFRRMLEYKTKWYGSRLFIVPRFFPSSKMCSSCNYVMQELPLSIRWWKCPFCGSEHDREENATENLLNYYYTASSAGIYACGDTSGGGMAQSQSTSHVPFKQELNYGIFVHNS